MDWTEELVAKWRKEQAARLKEEEKQRAKHLRDLTRAALHTPRVRTRRVYNEWGELMESEDEWQ